MPVKRLLLASALALALAACAQLERSKIDDDVADDVAQQYHACVPLGWDTVPVDGGDVLGASIEFVPNGWWINPTWSGYVPNDAVRNPDVRKITAFMRVLERHGLVQQTRHHHGTLYDLTMRGVRYYSDDDFFRDNRLDSPLLCYTHYDVVGHRVQASGAGFRELRIDWHSSRAASWAEHDSAIRANTIIMGPRTSPIFVRYTATGNNWQITAIRSQP